MTMNSTWSTRPRGLSIQGAKKTLVTERLPLLQQLINYLVVNASMTNMLAHRHRRSR